MSYEMCREKINKNNEAPFFSSVVLSSSLDIVWWHVFTELCLYKDLVERYCIYIEIVKLQSCANHICFPPAKTYQDERLRCIGNKCWFLSNTIVNRVDLMPIELNAVDKKQ